ncbi:MAG: BREX-1 system adenine-specific DNA-methyltransferase PglX, partial [Bacteroidales bacterium]|nr:BREX-1 system adenine-specific DNA-methyltransferase PglX [Bacteroidales bacterium]
MDTKRLKTFAAEARKVLMLGVGQRLEALGFAPNGSVTTEPQLLEGGAIFMGNVVSQDFYDKWQSLRKAISQTSVADVAEEASYTWFNRLMAIRIMVKNHLTSPVLEYEEEGSLIPLLVADARRGLISAPLQAVLTQAEKEQVEELLNNETKVADLFSLLIVAYCHSNPVINRCFGNMTDYTELLLPNGILSAGGFVNMLNNSPFITEEDFRSPELIGWLYQFYIADKKDDVFASFKKGKKAEAEDIPAATQIFTPNWIVKYMVQNTLGRIYLDNNPHCTQFRNSLSYLVAPTDPTSAESAPTDTKLRIDDLRDLTCADLACGSGHILNECFDLFYQLYTQEEGYSPRQAIEEIFRHNLTGIDLDTRAKQLATFALLLKACQRDASFADAHCMPRVLDMPRPWDFDSASSEADAQTEIRTFLNNFFQGAASEAQTDELVACLKLLQNATTLGSIMKFQLSDATRSLLAEHLERWKSQDTMPLPIRRHLKEFEVILALTQKYSALVMNPPYMGSGNMNAVLSKYVKEEYEEGKADLFSVFMLMGMERLQPNGKMAQINMQSWMFLSSFERMRTNILENYNIDSMLHLGPRTFDELSGEVVQNTSFVFSKHTPLEVGGTYFRLVDGKSCSEKESMMLSHTSLPHSASGNQIYYPNVSQKNFEKIPGAPIGYWVSEKMYCAFDNNLLNSLVPVKKGLDTGNNDYFLRYWHEISYKAIGIGKTKQSFLDEGFKWAPHDKGGSFRRWFGNNDWVINWENNGEELRHSSANLRSESLYFKKAITWNSLSSGKISFRLSDCGAISNTAGSSLFPTNDIYFYVGLLNCSVTQYCLNIVSPTLNYSAGPVGQIPILKNNETQISAIVETNITLSREDWDSHETSWDFQTNELVSIEPEEGEESNTLEWRMKKYKQK